MLKAASLGGECRSAIRDAWLSSCSLRRQTNFPDDLTGGTVNQISSRITWLLFFCAIAVLLVIALVGFQSTARYTASAEWVAHTHEVQTDLSGIRSRIYAADAARLQYILGDDPDALARFRAVTQELPYAVIALQKLTEDNAAEQQRFAQLRRLLDQRVGVLVESVSLHGTGQSDSADQTRLTVSGNELEEQVLTMLNTARDEEATLLAQRQIISRDSYARVRMMLVVSFIAALLLLSAMFNLTLRELRERRFAESAVRRLSQRLLRLQDDERRKMAREIHDGVGQLFVALKFNLSEISRGVAPPRTQELLAESLVLLDQGVAEARTLSYLLHPPLLEELGFSSAAQWFVEGFSQRSNVRVNLNLPRDSERMHPDVELALFRILQEALTNIHRHSGSDVADIRLEKRSGYAILTVQDYGRGIPPDRLEEFRRTGVGMGVGLAGMQERLRELKGTLDVESDGPGTLLRVTVPLAPPAQSGEASSNPPSQTAPDHSEAQKAPAAGGPGTPLLLAGPAS